MGITLWKHRNNRSEIERTFISFKGKNQLPLIMIIKEYQQIKVVYATVIYSTR